MAVTTRRELLEAGVHFGHQTRRWNPKMRRFIFGERGGIYIIDLEKTLQGLEKASAFIREVARRGDSVLFVGTKKQAQEIVAEQAERVGMPYVNTRWLGGMLTNFQTIYARLRRLVELREMERTGAFDVLPKKEVLKLRREKEKLERNLGGIQSMERVPGAVFVIDTKKEQIAVTEANKLGIPVVAIVDTNCDPD
jgi:small subunit ribosomal protein S2